jgi:hypothetical protein
MRCESQLFARGGVACCLALALCTGAARAELSLATPADNTTRIEHAEVAYAFGSDQPITWLSLRIDRGPLAVVVALPEGARLEPAGDAWFSALEETAAPRVLPPQAAAACYASLDALPVSYPRQHGRAPDAQLRVTAEDVQAALDVQGLVLPEGVVSNGDYAIWLWNARGAPFTTQTLRLQGGDAPAELRSREVFPVSLSAVTLGPMKLDAEQDKQRLKVTYHGDDSRHDYVSAAGAWLAEESAPLIESRGSTLLFDWTLYAERLTVAPLARSYANKAWALEDASSCAQQLFALRSPDADPATACGEANDFELALRAVRGPASLARWLVLSSHGIQPSQLESGGLPVTPAMLASNWDPPSCGSHVGPPVVVPPTPDVERPDGSTEPPSVSHEGYWVEEPEPVEVGCSGSPTPEPTHETGAAQQDVDCGSDSSGSSESDGDCSSDSSGSSEAGDCSSDSSGSSDEDCSSDSSSEADAESCDSGSDTGYDGETCTGSAAPKAAERRSALGAGGRTSARGQRPARLRLSLWSVAFVAIVLPIRRRKRPRRRDG